MKMTILTSNDEYSEGEVSEPLSQTLRTDNELFKDEDHIAQPIINVKFVKDCWQIIDNKNIVLTLKTKQFGKKHQEFLKSVDGVLFIISGYKRGWKTVTKFKEELRKYDHI